MRPDPISMETLTENVDGHQVVTMRTTVPDDMRVERIGVRPDGDDVVVVQMRLRRIGPDDPRWGLVPHGMLDNFITGD